MIRFVNERATEKKRDNMKVFNKREDLRQKHEEGC